MVRNGCALCHFIMKRPTIIVPEHRTDVFAALQADIMRLQGFTVKQNNAADVGLGPLKEAFPQGAFPLGAVHEFLSTGAEETSATAGFMAGMLSSLMGTKGTLLWVSSRRTLFPPALKAFGLAPDRFIFADIQRERDVLWAMDEALKCGALTAVVGEVHELSFTASRRLQLAVEQSHVTGFVLRHSRGRGINTTACVSRWRIAPLPGYIEDDMPGLGFPQWNVELLKMRNGKTGSWNIVWKNGQFHTVSKSITTLPLQKRKTG